MGSCGTWLDVNYCMTWRLPRVGAQGGPPILDTKSSSWTTGPVALFWLLSNYAPPWHLPLLKFFERSLTISYDNQEESVSKKKKQEDSKQTCLKARYFHFGVQIRASRDQVHSNCIDSISWIECPVYPPIGELTVNPPRGFFKFGNVLVLSDFLWGRGSWFNTSWLPRLFPTVKVW